MRQPWRAPRLVQVAALAAVLTFLALVARFWHPVYGFTAFFQLDASNDELKLTAFRELPVYVFRDTGGYDGLYYAQLALDPSLRDPQLPGAMDVFAYRARRILPSAAAWILGAGRPAGIIGAYSVVNVLAWLALAALLWRILDVPDLRGLLAWSAVLFSAGALCSVRLALTDLVAAALIAAALLAAERERKRTALGSMAAAALARETSLLSLAGTLTAPWFSTKNAARIAVAALPLAGWILYVRWRAGPGVQGWANFNWPVAGLVEKWREVATALFQFDDHWLAITTLLATAGICVQALYIVAIPEVKDRWWRVGAAYVVLMLTLGTGVWEGFPGAFTRVLLPLTMAFNVLAARRRAALALLVLGNLGVVSGLLDLRDVPSDPREVAVARAGRTAVIARMGQDWFGLEESRSHTWLWARDRGTLEIEAWPRSAPARAQMTFALRSLAPRTVVLRQDGREIWRSDVGTKLASHTVDMVAGGGRALLEFSTPEPAVRENDTPEGRDLGFALYDFRIAVRDR